MPTNKRSPTTHDQGVTVFHPVKFTYVSALQCSPGTANLSDCGQSFPSTRLQPRGGSASHRPVVACKGFQRAFAAPGAIEEAINRKCLERLRVEIPERAHAQQERCQRGIVRRVSTTVSTSNDHIGLIISA